MRRIRALVLVILAALTLSACHPIVESDTEPLSVYATFYPIYALTDAVLAGIPDASLHCLVQPQDGCLRNYQLSDWDLALLSAGADAVIMGGRGLESFESALFAWGDSGPAVSAVLYNLDLYGRNASAADAEAQSHIQGQNPHLYMSLEGAAQIVQSISAMLIPMDPRYTAQYADNAESAARRLRAALLDNRSALSACAGRRVVLMNEALIYTARDYDLEVADRIDRESGVALYDDELQACLERLSNAEARVVLIEKQAPARLVEAIEAAGFAVARIDILSTHREGEGFESYLSIQSDNAQAIRRAFERVDAREADQP